jgi:ABC-type glycerol-3-phosphate transport system substrate-binding protein
MTQQGPWMANYILNLKPSMSGLAKGSDDDLNAPLAERRARLHWAAAPFPSAVPGLTDVTICQFDTLCIPRGAKHPKEAFEFIAYVNQRHGTPQIPIYPEVDAELAVLVQTLALHPEADAASALTALQYRLQKIYDAFMEKEIAREKLEKAGRL